jgi:hypothetical protein
MESLEYAMPHDREKFKALVHYVCWRYATAPDKLGAVKLNKTLWRADFKSFYLTRHSITGARYIKRQYGPVPSGLKAVLQELVNEGVLTIGTTPYHGYDKHQFVAHSEPDLRLLTKQDIEIADEAMRFVCEEHTAKSISEESHDHIWRAAKDGEKIPYETVFAVPGEITDDEREWARQEIALRSAN